MTNYQKIAAILLSMSLIGSPCWAGESSVDITGKVLAFPCKVDPSTKDQTIDLGKWSSSGLAAAGSSHPPTAFNINVTDCPSMPGHVLTMKFQGEAAGDANDLYANSGSAGNVAVKITQRDNPTQVQGNGSEMTVAVSDEGAATFALNARLYSEKGGATEGSILSKVQFDFIYQ